REGVEGLHVALVDAEHVQVAVDRTVEVRELALVDLALRLEAADLVGPVRGRLDVPLVGVDELVPVLHVAIQAGEAVEGLEVVRVDVDDLLETLRRLRVLAELLLPHLRETQEQRDALALGRDDLELALEDLEEALPALRSVVQTLETLEGDEVRVVALVDLTVGRDGLVDLTEAILVALGDLELRLDVRGLRLDGASLRDEDVEELRPLEL